METELPTSTTKVEDVTNTNIVPPSEFPLPPWVMIGFGILAVIAGISFIWSQRHDISKYK